MRAATEAQATNQSECQMNRWLLKADSFNSTPITYEYDRTTKTH